MAEMFCPAFQEPPPDVSRRQTQPGNNFVICRFNEVISAASGFRPLRFGARLAATAASRFFKSISSAVSFSPAIRPRQFRRHVLSGDEKQHDAPRGKTVEIHFEPFQKPARRFFLSQFQMAAHGHRKIRVAEIIVAGNIAAVRRPVAEQLLHAQVEPVKIARTRGQ